MSVCRSADPGNDDEIVIYAELAASTLHVIRA
jgi:hypothetical protein